MNTCGSYGDDMVLEYKVPIRTNVSVQSGSITGKSSSYANTGRSGSSCNSCGINNYNSNGYSNGYSSGNGYTGYTGYNNATVRSVGNNWDNNPSCVVETRGNNRYRTCYYRDGTSTIETYPI
ncbi:unknown similar to AMEV088 [Choristoneura rosaceana entomopoxvirus 'L']|uniref:Uncharacterized protein n=1 Tax=Choristoneura rosaceana entomopoxvirus 'L' TaxID=1293539 RepID=A0ABM9QKH7_9POXV|nr:unknown similar to AMEV088 [Choristoneura rosaceana entomopoxvirus 'L']CCU56015.1 unknown similar to AMEV088 [Choristoneura rosaceana entomopoxvirus 'L']